MSQAGILNIESQPGVPLDFITDTGTSQAHNDVLYIVGGSGVTTVTTTTAFPNDTIQIDVSTTGFTWVVVTDANNPTQILPQHGYICSGASLCTFLLPLVPTVGDTFKIFSYTSRFKIIPNATQIITVGSASGMAGSGGTLTSTAPGDMVTFTCMGNNTFQAEAPQGTLTLVTS